MKFDAFYRGQDVWYGYWHTCVAEEASVRYDIDDFYTAVTSDHFNACKPCDKIDNRFQNLVNFLKQPRQARNSGPAPEVEVHAEIESTEALMKIVRSVQTFDRGVFLEIQDLERIRKFSGTNSLLMDCLSNAGMIRISGTAEYELWTRLV